MTTKPPKKKALAVVAEPAEASACKSSPTLNVFDEAKRPGGVSRPVGAFAGRAAMITLGCAKNHVDSEVMLGVLKGKGYEIVTDVSTADVAVVNTCGFLESAVKESIDSILSVAEHKKTGRLRQLVVAGCLVERYREDLKKSIPEVDSFITLNDLLEVDKAASGDGAFLERAKRPYFLYDDTMPRYLATQQHMAYVKIAEGCDRPCTFCIIPKIRGVMRSRPIESVRREVVSLGAQGVREINLVAQDLTSYGQDRKGNGPVETLTDLLVSLNDTAAVDWIRLLYSYPIGIDARLLEAIVKLPRVVEYLDLPLQHASESVLKRMKRPVGRYAPVRLIEEIKSLQPSIKMRTTFIVGFPGETDADVAALEQFIRGGYFSSVGIFTYSQETGTPAATMDEQVPDEVKAERRNRLMEAQQQVVERQLQGYVGQELEVLVEGPHAETDLLIAARTRFQAPEVDGTVLINDIAPEFGDVQSGTIGRVEVTEVAGYDLVGRLVAIDSEPKAAVAMPASSVAIAQTPG